MERKEGKRGKKGRRKYAIDGEKRRIESKERNEKIFNRLSEKKDREL